MYLLFDPLHTAAVWAGSNVWMIFAVGAFAGCVSFNVSLKIRKAAAQFKEAVHYEELKAALNERRAARRQKLRFLFPFAGASLSDAVHDMLERQKERLRTVRDSVRRKKGEPGKKDEEEKGE